MGRHMGIAADGLNHAKGRELALIALAEHGEVTGRHLKRGGRGTVTLGITSMAGSAICLKHFRSGSGWRGNYLCLLKRDRRTGSEQGSRDKQERGKNDSG